MFGFSLISEAVDSMEGGLGCDNIKFCMWNNSSIEICSFGNV